MQPKAQSPDKITQPKTKEKEAVTYFPFTHPCQFFNTVAKKFLISVKVVSSSNHDECVAEG